MTIPIFKAPSHSIAAQTKKNSDSITNNKNKSNSIILILSGIIICLLLIIMSILIKPSLQLASQAEEQKISSEIIAENIISDSEEREDEGVEKREEQDIINHEINLQKKNKPEEVDVDVKPELNHDKADVNEKIIDEVKADENKPQIEINNKETENKILQETLDNQFNKIIDETLYNIEKSKFSEAEKKLNAAKKLKPDEAIIIDLRQRLNEAYNQYRINNLLQKALYKEKKEQWKSSLKLYDELLKIDENINRVLLKKERILLYIKYENILNKIINKPERLQSDKVFEASKNSLQFVRQDLINNQDILYPMQQTPLLFKTISKAEKTIQQASIQISVHLQSDNLTDIVIYKVGKLGKFKEKELSLRPGIYTIVGSKEGYRDFRKNIKIDANLLIEKQFLTIRVECKETI